MEVFVLSDSILDTMRCNLVSLILVEYTKRYVNLFCNHDDFSHLSYVMLTTIGFVRYWEGCFDLMDLTENWLWWFGWKWKGNSNFLLFLGLAQNHYRYKIVRWNIYSIYVIETAMQYHFSINKLLATNYDSKSINANTIISLSNYNHITSCPFEGRNVILVNLC